MKSFMTAFASVFARDDPVSTTTLAVPDLRPPLRSSAGSSAPWRSDSYGHATTLLHSGSVDAYVTQHALYPSSAWWLR